MAINNTIISMQRNLKNAYDNLENKNIIIEKNKNLLNFNYYIDSLYKDLLENYRRKNSTGTTELNYDNAKAFNVLDGRFTGNEYQETTTGKNLADFPTDTQLPINAAKTLIDFGEDRTFSSITTTFYLKNATFTNDTAAIISYRKDDGTDKYILSSLFGMQKDTVLNGTYTRTESNITFRKLLIFTWANFTQGTMSIQTETGNKATDYEPYTNGASPNPEYPQEIETLKGYNLMNLEIQPFSQSGINYSTENQVLSIVGTASGTSGTKLYEFIPQDNVDYTFQIFSNDLVSGVSINVQKYLDNTYKEQISLGVGKTSYTFKKTDSTFNKIVVRVQVNNGITTNSKVKIQLLEGTEQKPYLPYGSVGIKRIGKNLFDKNNVRNGYRLGSDGTYYPEAGYSASEFIKVKPNTSYTRNKNINIMMPICTYDKNGTFIERIISGNTIITPNNCYYIKTAVSNANLDTTMLNLGNTALDYEPYQERIDYIDLKGNELLSIDEIKIDNGNVKLIKNWGKVVLNGSENWIYQSEYDLANTKQFILTNAATPLNIYNGKSNYFKWTSGWTTLINSDENMIQLYLDKALYIRISNTLATDLATFKSWLSTHNTEVYYRLATPQIIDLGEVNIKTLEGLNDVELLATLEPTFMSETYMCRENDNIEDYLEEGGL